MHTKTFHMYITRLHKNGRGIFYFGYELSTFIQYKRTAFYCMLNERWWMRWWQSDWLIVCRLNCSVQSGWSIFPLQKLLPTIKGICGHSIKWNCLEFHSSNWFLFANGPKYVYHCYHQQIASDESLSSKMENWLMEKRHTSGMHGFIEIDWKYGILPEFKYGISTGWIHTYFAVGHFFFAKSTERKTVAIKLCKNTWQNYPTLSNFLRYHWNLLWALEKYPFQIYEKLKQTPEARYSSIRHEMN